MIHIDIDSSFTSNISAGPLRQSDTPHRSNVSHRLYIVPEDFPAHLAALHADQYTSNSFPCNIPLTAH